MEIYRKIINCKKFDRQSKMKKNFTVIEYSFSYITNEKDKNFIDKIIKNGEDLAKKVNKSTANNSTVNRNSITVKNNAISGLLAEFIWKHFLNKNKIKVSETKFDNVSNQIDLLIKKNNRSVEVRSSFPIRGIRFAVCHNRYEFDIIGPYSNNYKSSEIQKDYYVRVLFPFRSDLFLQRVKQDKLNVYLVGGATWDMMCNDNIAEIKSLIPENELNYKRVSTKSKYRVIPYHNALDTVEIVERIKSDLETTGVKL